MLDKKGSESGSLSLCGLAFAVQDSLGFVGAASGYLNELGGVIHQST